MSLKRFDSLVGELKCTLAGLADKRTGDNVLTFCDDAYRLIRATLPTRETFFQHIRALTTYMPFSSWGHLMDFMMRGLEIGPYATQEA